MITLPRRDFVRQGLFGATSLALLPYLNTSCMSDHPLPYAKQIGLQLYTLRFQLEEDTPGTLAALKDMGYQQVELMDIVQDQEKLKIARDLGLTVNSSFFNWTAITRKGEEVEDIDRVIDQAKAAQLSHLVFGYIPKEDRGTLDDYHHVIDGLLAAGEKCNKEGIQLCYHHHSFEFEPIDGVVPFELLMDKLDAELVQFELDVFWASIGGYDPLELMDRLAGRIRLLHLKDKQAGTVDEFDESEIPHEAFQALGKGIVPIKTILQKAQELQVDHCFVEQDWSPTPLSSVKHSYQYMQGA